MSGEPGGPVPGLDFTAIDFETANGFRGSPCAVGAVRVRDGAVVATAEWTMRPPPGFDRFDPRNVRIHGITAEQVAGAPRYGEVHGHLSAFCGSDVIVAHNAGFDVGVIESALEVSDADVPSLEYACTLLLARRAYELPSYALPSAAREAGFELVDHHDALADARACAAILIDVGRRHRAARSAQIGGAPAAAPRVSVADVYAGHGLGTARLAGRRAGEGEPSRATRQGRAMQEIFDATVPLRSGAGMPDFLRWPQEGANPEPNRQAPRAHPLYGQTVVFTGALGLARPEAKVRAAACGAQTSSRVGASTTMLVLGDGFRAEDLDRTPGAPACAALGHRKTRDALARRARGQHLELVSEPEFLQMLDDNWPAESPN